MSGALEQARRRHEEISGLLAASRAVLEAKTFMGAARSIYDNCRDLTGATAGYVALLTEDGAENEVLFLDAGGEPCTVDPELPMPIRGLRDEAYRTGGPVYDNEFPQSDWMRFMPDGHAELANVLFAALLLEGPAVGLIDLGAGLGSAAVLALSATVGADEAAGIVFDYYGADDYYYGYY